MFNVSSIERKSICRASLDTHTAESLIHCAKTFARFFHLNVEVMRIGFVDGILIQDSYRSLGIAMRDLLPCHKWFGKFKRTVLHSFRIEAAVGAEINVFKEKPKHRRRNVAAGLIYLDGDSAGLRDGKLRLKRETHHTNESHNSA